MTSDATSPWEEPCTCYHNKVQTGVNLAVSADLTGRGEYDTLVAALRCGLSDTALDRLPSSGNLFSSVAHGAARSMAVSNLHNIISTQRELLSAQRLYCLNRCAPPLPVRSRTVPSARRARGWTTRMRPVTDPTGPRSRPSAGLAQRWPAVVEGPARQIERADSEIPSVLGTAEAGADSHEPIPRRAQESCGFCALEPCHDAL